MNVSFRPGTRILITKGSATAENFGTSKSELLETVRLAADAGIEAVQIREKSLPARLLFEVTAEAVTLVKDSETEILVNERFDVAMVAGAPGVHLPSTSIPIDYVKKLLPVGMIIGVSAHSFGEVEKAQDGGADYVMLGPVFGTPGKGEPLGIGKFSEIVSALAPFPIIAVGGIDGTNQELAIDVGATGFAAIRYLNDFVRIGQ